MRKYFSIVLLILLAFMSISCSNGSTTTTAVVREGTQISIYNSPEPYRLAQSDIILLGGEQVEVLAQDNNWSQISKDDVIGWIPTWYLVNNESLTKVTPYYRSLSSDNYLYLHPEGKEITSISEGKLLKITHEYGDWCFAYIIVYDIPAVQEGWIKKSLLSEEPAKEGLLPEGTEVIYQDGNTEITTFPMPVFIISEEDNRVYIGAAGGWTAYTDIENIVFSELLFAN